MSIKTTLRSSELEEIQSKIVRVPFTLTQQAFDHIQKLADRLGCSKSKVVEALIRQDRTEGEELN